MPETRRRASLRASTRPNDSSQSRGSGGTRAYCRSRDQVVTAEHAFMNLTGFYCVVCYGATKRKQKESVTCVKRSSARQAHCFLPHRQWLPIWRSLVIPKFPAMSGKFGRGKFEPRGKFGRGKFGLTSTGPRHASSSSGHP